MSQDRDFQKITEQAKRKLPHCLLVGTTKKGTGFYMMHGDKNRLRMQLFEAIMTNAEMREFLTTILQKASEQVETKVQGQHEEE